MKRVRIFFLTCLVGLIGLTLSWSTGRDSIQDMGAGKNFIATPVYTEQEDMVKNTIRGYASFGNQYMDIRMKIDAIAESLDHGHYSRHKL